MHIRHAFREDRALTSRVDVAYAAEAIEMRDIGGSDFRFAKTLTLPFFGSGMVDLPPGGAKRVKNSRKMQLIFFVYYGRVTVEVGTPTTTFSIGKGGMWQVPRGKCFFFFSLNLEMNLFSLFIIPTALRIAPPPGAPPFPFASYDSSLNEVDHLCIMFDCSEMLVLSRFCFF